MTGFWGGPYLGWVGQRPVTPEREREIEAANLARVAAEAARREEENRPQAERIARVKAELLAQVPADLARAVIETAAEQTRLRFRVAEVARELADLQANEPENEEELATWLEKKLALELQLPHLRRFEQKAGAAYSNALDLARRSIKSAVAERNQAAFEALKQFEQDMRTQLEAEKLTQRLVQAACSAAENLTAADLADMTDSGQPANDNSKTRKGKG